MQWLIDIAKEAMENWIYDNGIYRYRGDPAAVDYWYDTSHSKHV